MPGQVLTLLTLKSQQRMHHPWQASVEARWLQFSKAAALDLQATYHWCFECCTGSDCLQRDGCFPICQMWTIRWHWCWCAQLQQIQLQQNDPRLVWDGTSPTRVFTDTHPNQSFITGTLLLYLCRIQQLKYAKLHIDACLVTDWSRQSYLVPLSWYSLCWYLRPSDGLSDSDSQILTRPWNLHMAAELCPLSLANHMPCFALLSSNSVSEVMHAVIFGDSDTRHAHDHFYPSSWINHATELNKHMCRKRSEETPWQLTR